MVWKWLLCGSVVLPVPEKTNQSLHGLNVSFLSYKTQQGDVNMPNSRGQTALYCASRQGYGEIVLELLLAPGIDVNVQVPEHGGTPFHGSSFPFPAGF